MTDKVMRMPRVREIEEDGGDPILKEEFAKERELFGDVLNTTKIMAHCPPILRARPANTAMRKFLKV